MSVGRWKIKYSGIFLQAPICCIDLVGYDRVGDVLGEDCPGVGVY